MAGENLILIVGQEGAGKSTMVRALAPEIPWSARIDAEDLSYVNPWGLDDLRLNLLWKNVADLTKNYWAAGFRNMVAGSFLSNIDHYDAFRGHLNAEADAWVIHLCAGNRFGTFGESSAPNRPRRNGGTMSIGSIPKTTALPRDGVTIDTCASTTRG